MQDNLTTPYDFLSSIYVVHTSENNVKYIVIIIIIFIVFMQGIYNYMPETNDVSRTYSVAAILCLQLVLPVMLFRLLYLH